MTAAQHGGMQGGDPPALRIGLFFDGTRNNAHNLARGRPRTPQPRPAQLRADDGSTYQSRLTSSYDNGTTNITRLYQLYPDSWRAPAVGASLAIYVEGVGTRDDAEDDLIGLAFGVGASGVRAKVQRALQVLLPAALAALAAKPPAPLRSVQVGLFGFSRGAAAARDVANQLQGWDGARWQQLLQQAGLACAADFAVQRPVLRFIGLFDTVVAVSGGRADEQPQLALPAHSAGRVVQLVARDEHRQHYPLTTVAPAHAEIVLPGVHANIGGGYDQTEEGPKLLSRLRRAPLADYQTPSLAQLQATTVYAEAQADAERWRQQLGLDEKEVWVDVWHQWQQQRRAGSRSVLLAPALYVTAAVVLRRRIDWRYQLIALHVMHVMHVMQRQASEAGVQWTAQAADVPDWALPTALQPIARRLLAGQALTPTQEALLRRRYLMQSAHWNFDALGDTALAYAADAGMSELPYRPGPALFYINRPTVDGKRVVLPDG